MNDFMVFTDRDHQASELDAVSQYVRVIADYIRVENKKIDNSVYLRVEEKIKELISTASPILAEITNILMDKNNEVTGMKNIFKYEDFDGENSVDEVGKDIQNLIYGQSVVEVRHVDDYNIKLILSNGLILHAMSNEGCGGCSNGWYDIDNVLDLGVTGNVITKVEVESPKYAEDGTYKLFIYSMDKRMLEVDFTGCDNGYYGTGIVIHVKSHDEDY